MSKILDIMYQKGARRNEISFCLPNFSLSLVVVIIALPFGLSAGLSAMGSQAQLFAARSAFFVSFMVLNVLVWLLYFTYFEGTSGQTLGKKIMGIKVVKENGDQPSFMDALIRTILRIIDGIAFYLVGFIVILVSEKKQRLGDMAAGTIVVEA
ncbi:MAG: RDD family protein, partial [Methanosarcinales archaeon]